MDTRKYFLNKKSCRKKSHRLHKSISKNRRFVTLEQTEPDNKTVILVKYGTFEKSYELMLTLHLSVYDDGCSESGATGYTRDLNYPQ